MDKRKVETESLDPNKKPHRKGKVPTQSVKPVGHQLPARLTNEQAKKAQN